MFAIIQDALKVRKGDFDNIVDDISDGEGDEAAGMQARAEMELAEDRARDRAIITAVTEGHDAMRNKSKKGVYSFEKLVGDSAVTGSRRRRKGEEGNDGANEVVEEEEDEEELMQRGMQNRLDKERASRARRGTGEFLCCSFVSGCKFFAVLAGCGRESALIAKYFSCLSPLN